MPRMNLYLLTTLLCGALGAGACSVEIGGLQGSQTTDPSTSRGGGPGGAVFGRGGGAAPDTLACEPSAAPSVFNNALCLCGDYQGAGNLRIQPAVDRAHLDAFLGVLAQRAHGASPAGQRRIRAVLRKLPPRG